MERHEAKNFVKSLDAIPFSYDLALHLVGTLDRLVAYYRPQVELYRKFWKDTSGEDVKEAGLYFIDAKKWVAV
jgi:hypothetical protein